MHLYRPFSAQLFLDALPASTLAGLQAFARLDKPAQRELLEGLRRLLVSLGTGGAYPHPKEYSHERN